jgi:hypothetical protein
MAIGNLAQALLMLGDWDAAATELTHAADADGLADHELLACYRGWLAALRGDAETAETVLTGLQDLKTSEAPQEKAVVSHLEAFIAAARHQPRDTLRCARATLAQASAIGISHELPRWAWPLATRAAHNLRDTATTRELLAQLDSHQPGHLAPMLWAERDLTGARLAANDSDAGAAELFSAAIATLREHSTLYHLGHGLLDYAQHLRLLGDDDAAGTAISEGRGIAQRLRCQPLLDRAADLTPAEPSARP